MLTPPRRSGRPARGRALGGFTLVEILVTMTILAIFGAVFVRFLIAQGRFTDQQNAMRGARAVTRQALNLLESDLRMVQDSGGIDSVSADGRTIRALVPYRFGLYCGVSSGGMVVSMLPADSLVLAQARYTGFAWRSGRGTYTPVYPGAPQGADAPVTSSDPNQCTGAGPGQARLRTLSIGGRSGAVLDIRPVQLLAVPGQPVFFFQRITYSFAASTTFPGTYGLYRSVQGGANEEIMAPFDSTSRFRFWTSGATAAVSTIPALGEIRGVDVVFAARSRYTPIGRSSPSKSSVVASIFFRNIR